MDKKEQQFAIVLKETDKLIGNCGFVDINHLHQRGEVGLFIGEEENRSKGYGTEALSLLVEYGFNYLNLKNAVLSKNIIVTGTSILNVVIAGIDGLSVVIEYMYFGEDKISKYQYFLRVDEYYKWKQVSSIQEQILLKVDDVLDDTSNNAVANKLVTSIIKKIINWH